MTDFNSLAFLSIGNQAISLGQALQYLQRSGQLNSVLNNITSQHLLLQELQSRNDLQIGVAELEVTVQNFRARQQLTEPAAFEQWLANSGLSYTAFLNQVGEELKLEKLKSLVSEQEASNYFEQNHISLDQIKLTYIVITEKEMAEALRQRLDEGNASFEDIARECINEAFFNNSEKVSLKKETVRRGQVRAELKQALEGAVAGTIVGPLEVDQRWWVLKVEELIEAKLEGELKQQLETEFFRQWLNQKMQQIPVAFAVG
jgi:parvulin-like peptidyl-prolyl isomerase